MRNMLSVAHLTKKFVMHTLHGRVIEGFNEVNFTVERGHLLGLSGMSGAGKSSVLKCIYRAYLPSTGEILYQSERLGSIDLVTIDDHRMIMLRQAEIGYVTQFLNVVPRVSALDTVAEPLLAKGVGVETARKKAGEMLEKLYIPGRLFDACPVTFSGGEQQRVNFAAGVITEPRLLLLDEPTASLDAATRKAVIDILMELKAKGTTIVAIFHDQQIMDAVADRIYTMKRVGESVDSRGEEETMVAQLHQEP